MIKIDADHVTEARLSADGTRVLLTLLDAAGQKISLGLPTGCLNALLSVVPRHTEPGEVRKLDTWSIEVTETGQDLALTPRTPEGLAICFALKPWQVEVMATIATYGASQRPQAKTMHQAGSDRAGRTAICTSI